MPSRVQRKNMEQHVEQKPPRINVMHLGSHQIKIPDLDMNDLKRHSHMLVSPTSQAAARKSPSERWNCLCSPTTHAGSFRCRHHRATRTGMTRGRSVGSNLSALGSKAGSISDSLHAQ